MKILQIDSSLGPGGAEKLIADLVLASSEKMDVLILDNSYGRYGEILQQQGIKVIKPNSSRSYFSLLNLFFLWKHIKQYDVIHVHCFPCVYWIAFINLFISKKYIYTEHNTFNKRRKYTFFRPIEKFIYSRYDSIACVSDLVAVQLKLWLGNNWRNISVIKNGINLDNYIDAVKYNKTDFPNCTDEDVILAMVARFSSAKDQPTLIKAMVLLPENYKLLLVGGGERENEYKDLVDNLDLSNRVNFLGFRTDVPNILKSVDICVLSSHWEGMPLSAIESMASGRPLIASDVGGIREIVLGAGVLFEHENEKELYSRILELKNNREIYSEISAKCLERAKEFDIYKVLDSYYKLYNK
jgi:glycosyltransferase involved in cell wall biosynthesis